MNAASNAASNVANYDYSGAAVLVTGGTQGIGFGIASAFKSAGANVTVTGTRASADDYADTENDLSGFEYLQLQVKDIEAIKRLPEKLGRLDILVNNAGASLPGGQSEWDHDVFDESVQINLNSNFHVSQACFPLLEQSELCGGAVIIGIASLTSFLAVEFVPGYGAAKAGLVQLTKTLGMSWAKNGIRANAIAAGLIETRMTSMVKMIPEMDEAMMARTPMKRWGQPEDIAGCALFLASANASFVTGQTLICDGGYSVVG